MEMITEVVALDSDGDGLSNEYEEAIVALILMNDPSDDVRVFEMEVLTHNSAPLSIVGDGVRMTLLK